MRISNTDIHVVSSTAAINFKLAYGLNDIPLLQQNAEAKPSLTFQLTDRLLIQRDMLWCGPTPKCTNINTWKQIRAEFIKGFFLPEYPDVSFNNLKTDLLYDVNRLNEVEAIYIWAGTNLEDQLLILFVIYLVGLTSGHFEKISIVQFESVNCFGETLQIFGMGHLDPDDMQKHPEPIALTTEQAAFYRMAWDSVTSDTPLALMQLLSSAPNLNKHLVPALHYLLRRYPRIESGLDYWDIQILSNIGKNGSAAVKIIMGAWGENGENLEGDPAGETYLFNKMLYLGSKDLPEPLLALSGTQTSYRDTKVSLTKFGSAVMNGKASFYPANPIDKWVGGVHLSSAMSNLWFYQNGRVDTI
ncbi:MAG: hypothetical protein Q8N96_00950 [Methylovulum sp.]|nr:hypothetical protein [Methylovulum sp.]